MGMAEKTLKDRAKVLHSVSFLGNLDSELHEGSPIFQSKKVARVYPRLNLLGSSFGWGTMKEDDMDNLLSSYLDFCQSQKDYGKDGEKLIKVALLGHPEWNRDQAIAFLIENDILAG